MPCVNILAYLLVTGGRISMERESRQAFAELQRRLEMQRAQLVHDKVWAVLLTELLFNDKNHLYNT